MHSDFCIYGCLSSYQSVISHHKSVLVIRSILSPSILLRPQPPFSLSYNINLSFTIPPRFLEKAQRKSKITSMHARSTAQSLFHPSSHLSSRSKIFPPQPYHSLFKSSTQRISFLTFENANPKRHDRSEETQSQVNDSSMPAAVEKGN